jgi:HEPN domain-containing protein
MDICTITKEYEDCVLKIEKSTKRYVGTHFASSLLREITKNTRENNPNIYAAKCLEELRGKSYYFNQQIKSPFDDL